LCSVCAAKCPLCCGHGPQTEEFSDVYTKVQYLFGLIPTTPKRIPVGARVSLTKEKTSENILEGPLSVGDIGKLIHDSHDEKPYQVEAQTGSHAGVLWYYNEDEITEL
jgi:hypothetical protein